MTQVASDGKVPDDRSAGELVTQLTEQVSRLVRDELKLAQLELQQKGRRAGTGIGLFGGAAVIAMYGVGALVACAVLLLALVLPAWAAALIVAVLLFVLVGVLALVGRSQVLRATPPLPEEAIASVRQDVATVREKAHR